MYAVLGMYALFGSTFTLGKYALMYAKPIFLIGTRMVVAGLLLLGYVTLVRRQKLRIHPAHCLLFAGIVFFHIYAAYVCEFWALQYLTAAKTCLLYSLSPFISALVSYVAFGELMTPRKWVGLVIGFAAFIPVLISCGPSVENLVGSWLCISYPEIAMLISVISSVIGWTIMRMLLKTHEYSALMVNGVGMVGGGLLALATSWVAGEWLPVPFTQVGPFIFWMLALVVVANIICYNLYGALLRKYTATLLSFAGFTCPLFAAFFGWFFLGESVGRDFFFSLIFVALGLYLFYQEELRQGYIEKGR